MGSLSVDIFFFIKLHGNRVHYLILWNKQTAKYNIEIMKIDNVTFRYWNKNLYVDLVIKKDMLRNSNKNYEINSFIRPP